MAGTTNGVVVNSSALPTGAATVANQASQLAALTTANGRAQVFSPLLANTPLAANSSAATAERASGAITGGAAGPMTKYNVYVRAGDQPLTLNILGRAVSNGTTFTVSTQTIAANTSVNVTVPVMFAIYLAQIVNGATATTGIYAADSFTTN